MKPAARFVIDECSLDLERTAPADASKALASLALLIQECRARHGVEASDELLGSPCWNGKSVCEALYTPGLDQDARLLLCIQLDRCARWELCDEDLVAVEVDGVMLDLAPGISRAHRAASERRGLACLRVAAGSRVAAVTIAAATETVHMVADAQGVRTFFRSLFALEDVSKEQFFSLATDAFPRLRFVDGLSFGRFRKRYGCRDEVVRHLGALDDWGVELFAEFHAAPHEIAKRLSALGAIDVSGESPSTRAGPHMGQRDVTFEGHVYRCEWHSKLTPTMDRIHFHGPAPAFPDALLIGIFVDHLSA